MGATASVRTSVSRCHRPHGAGISRLEWTKGSETRVLAATCSAVKAPADKLTVGLGRTTSEVPARGKIAVGPGKIRATSALEADGRATLAATGTGMPVSGR